MPGIGQPGAAHAPARNGAFDSVSSLRPRRSAFNLSHEKKLTFDFGQLVPVCCMEMVPGDTFDFSTDVAIRFQPMIAPPMHQIEATVHYFFVPNRLVWPKIDTSGNDWETFITGGVNGTSAPVAPRWNVSAANCNLGSLWDYFGLPVNTLTTNFLTTYPDAVAPIDFPKRAYNLIWNEWYRDETLQTALDITANEVLQLRNWTKDFWTSALPWLQRGTSPAFPISGSTSAIWGSAVAGSPVAGTNAWPAYSGTNLGNMQQNTVSSVPGDATTKATLEKGVPTVSASIPQANINANTVSLSGATTFTINDFRLNAVIQRLLERNARGGIRYTEFLQSNYGTAPRDDRLQRPEYIGGVKQPVVISEVLQTSNVTSAPTPSGSMFGHGLSVGRNYVGKYSAVEFGYVIGILSCMPVPAYQQGIPKNWSRVSRYDYFYPEFVGLSEQAVLNQELFVTNDSANQTIFGYQGRFNELRFERSTVHGLFQTTLNFWHLGRIFASRPALNSSFISLSATELTSLKRIFAVPSQPGLLASVGNNITAYRPMPVLADPGLRVI